MRTRRRAAVAVLVALCGVAIAGGSVLSWITARGRRPSSGIRHTAISGMLHWRYQPAGLFTHSVAMVILVAGALVFVGGVFASRIVAGLFSLVALAASGAWIGLNATHYNPVNLPYSDLRLGAWLAVGGGLIGLLSSFFMRHSAL
jgi:hypothetical protein